MNFSELNDKNYLLFAIKYYDNPQSVTEDDFYDDLKRFKYVKRLFKRYETSGVLKVNLILNHLIILFNIFGEATVPLLFYKLEQNLWPCAKTFLIFLNRFPEYPKSSLTDIPIDETCLQELNQI
tara:strand:- start:142 stop:513 length:372 start_codon:yes stop_codon:yes gene_type:complete